jgi:hypothetical protein
MYACLALRRSFRLGEYGRGDAVGDLELLTDTPVQETVHAVRDTELARIPFHLFNVLAAQYPQVRWPQAPTRTSVPAHIHVCVYVCLLCFAWRDVSCCDKPVHR